MAKSVTGNDGEPIEWRTPLPTGTEITFTVPDARSTYPPVRIAVKNATHTPKTRIRFICSPNHVNKVSIECTSC